MIVSYRYASLIYAAPLMPPLIYGAPMIAPQRSPSLSEPSSSLISIKIIKWIK